VSGTPTLKKEYGYRNGLLLVIAETAGTLQWVVTDALGTSRMIADQTGSLSGIKRRDYLPFGEEILAGVGHRQTANGYSAAQSQQPRQQFTGKERDSEMGLDYFFARYYSSIQGRFASVDPENAGAYRADPQSWNGYAYARNNPVVFSDPDGLAFKICIDGKCFPLSDADAQKYIFDKSRQKELNFYTKNDGKIYNHDGTVIGTYTNLGCDCWEPWQRAIVRETASELKNPLLVAINMGHGRAGRPINFGRFGMFNNRRVKEAVETLKRPGTHNDIGGIIPTREEAEKLISEAGGKIKRIERAHESGRGHDFPHINYETASGEKATIRVESVNKQWYAPGEGKFKDRE
jgi:RHS repeat-associated protein